MTDTERLQLTELLERAIQDTKAWEIISTGSAAEIMALTARGEINMTVSQEAVQEFVGKRIEYLQILGGWMEGQKKEQLNQIVEMFRKGIRVMDHTDPSYYGIR